MKVIIKSALKPQLFATSWLRLFETPITADKQLHYALPKFSFGNFFYPRNVMPSSHKNEFRIRL